MIMKGQLVQIQNNQHINADFHLADLLGILIYLYNIIALVLTYIRVVQRMAHLLISHIFYQDCVTL